MYTTEQIKALREKTGAGISEVKKALEEAKGDMARAEELVVRRLGASAAKRTGREVRAGLVESYVHGNGRVGAMVELFCETDFVARNPEFRALAHDLALHIAALAPRYTSQSEVPKDAWDAEAAHVREETKGMQKPSAVLGSIVEGKLKSHFAALSLLDQQFVKGQNKTVGEVVNEAIGKFGENIKVGRFVRFDL